MLSVLSRGERMVRSEVVTLDPTGVAELSERGISGVQSGDLASVLVVEDRKMVANRAWLVVNETQEIEIAWETAALLARGFTGLDNKDFASIVWNVSASAELSLEEVATSGAGADELALLPEAEPAVPASPRTLSYSPTFPPRREGKVASPREKGALVKKNAKGGQGDLMSGPIAAKTVTSALAKTLAGVGLDAHVATFGKANILTLKTLQMHTLSQVEQSLRRPELTELSSLSPTSSAQL